MQTDPSLSLQIKLADRVPVREIEFETAAKSPDVSLSNIESVQNFPDNTTEPVDAQFLEKLRKHVLYDHFLTNQPKEDPADSITGLFSLTQVPQVNLIENNDIEDIINDLPDRSQSLDLAQEQRKDEVISWLARGSPDQSPDS